MFLLINYSFDIFRLQFLASCTNYELHEDGQELAPKHVGATTNRQKHCEKVGIQFTICNTLRGICTILNSQLSVRCVY